MGDNVGDRVDEQSVYQQVRWSVYDPNGITSKTPFNSSKCWCSAFLRMVAPPLVGGRSLALSADSIPIYIEMDAQDYEEFKDETNQRIASK